MNRRGAALLVALATAAAAPLPAAPPSPGIDTPSGLQQIHADLRGRVVGVTYTIKPMEVEPGVEGPKAEGVLCGVVVDPNGLIVIAGDVFPEPGGDPRLTLAPTDFKVHLGDDRVASAAAAGIDRDLNLAFLRIEPAALGEIRPVKFRESPRLQVGDPLLLVGVLGRKYGLAPAIFKATVNAEVKGPLPLLGVDTLIQDLTVGGLVLRRDGSAAGLVVRDVISEEIEGARSPGNILSILANIGQPQNHRPGYAMVLPYPSFAASLGSPPPLDLASDVKRAWLGIVMQALSTDLRDYWKLPVAGGIIVGSVIENSPAQAAGLRPGDILTSFGGEPLRITEDAQLPEFRRRVEVMGVDRDVPVEVWRSGSPLRMSVRLDEAPKTASFAEEYEDDDFGMTVREVTVDVQQALNLDRDFKGVYVAETEESGAADVAGLAPQDILLAVNGATLRTVDDLRGALGEIKLRRDPEAVFFVMRPPDTLFVRLKTDFGGRRDGTPAER